LVFLRLLIGEGGNNLLTFQQIADLVGHSDRRNVNNFWREFEQHGSDILAYLSRKVDLVEWIPMIESFVINNLLLPVSVMYQEFISQHKLKMSYATFCKYASQINALSILKQAQKLLAEKAADGDTLHLLKLLAGQHNVPVICDEMIAQKETKKQSSSKRNDKVKSYSSLERRNLCSLVLYLVGSNMNFETIALLLNTCKATVSNLWHEMGDVQSFILNSIAKWSGKVSIDEKYLKINGIPHYAISIVDFVTGLPLFSDIYPDTKKASYEACFRTFKQIYKKNPTLIVSDGSKALAAARKTVFPKVHFQLCKFHKIRNLFKKISKCHLSEDKDRYLKHKIMKAFRRETASGRKKGILCLISVTPPTAAEYIKNNIIQNWRHLSKGLTSNASERWNRKIKKVTSGKYGLKSVDTARMLVFSLWFKELVDKGNPILRQESHIASLNISQLCQENVDWQHLDRFFSICGKKAA
jgi:transposase-like protein